uniref:Kappa-scoloptoxin(15)-Ssd2a n=1 Tax=Scolopendra dehaani TaxID=2609776 RepID=TXF2A_SCODE|nr:RecName: Full=Kappa-scoloptoxin(15)-Ssd2a; Short=Kappa-SLPTX(15)-Ssd2a; AltName: Full=Toxin SSD559; Flags: Precursor [Scolopendra dehaani]
MKMVYLGLFLIITSCVISSGNLIYECKWADSIRLKDKNPTHEFCKKKCEEKNTDRITVQHGFHSSDYRCTCQGEKILETPYQSDGVKDCHRI